MAYQAGTSSAGATASRRLAERGDGGYDVFLNFRGSDTRHTVADVLYDALTRAGFRVFFDNEEIRKGEVIGEELLSAITNSKIYITIFSKDYASSQWCFRELEKIVECWRNSGDSEMKKVILPIFYDVDVSKDLKLRSDLYWTALQKHKYLLGDAAVKPWEDALKEVTTISGWNLKDHGLVGLADLIEKKVLSIVNTYEVAPIVPDRLVGIHDQIKDIMLLLDAESFDSRFIVIHGMGGIGKTTLAKSVFEKISSNYQGSCILSDIRRSSSDNDMVKLQEKLLIDTLNLKSIEVSNIDDGINKISRRLHNLKVLIILDDVDKRKHLKILAAKSNWFGPHSRIIMTTRNIGFLQTEDSEDYHFYDMKMLDHDQALELFCRHAFENNSPLPKYSDISIEIVDTTGGLPLAIEVIGSSLYSQDYETWEFRLEKLKEAPYEDVQETLIISYHALEYEQQQIFLDIACFFNDEEMTDPIYFWKACKFYPDSGINILVRKSLIKVIGCNKLWMHDQLRDLGRAIALSKVQRLGSLTPKRPSRLWSPKAAFDVVQKKEGTESIVALQLQISDVNYNFVREEFVRLVNLKFLRLEGGNFEGDFKNVFQELKWLSWFNCPMEFQATNLSFDNLVMLTLSGIHITESWGGWQPIMAAKNLKVLNLQRCPFLTRMLGFSTFPTLERLILRGCNELKEIDQSIGCLKSLTVLEINEAGLTELHSSIGELVALKRLCLNCPYLGNLPSFVGKLTSLLELDICNSKIKELPDSIGDLRELNILKAYDSMVHYIPESIGRLESLNELNLEGTKITELPETIGNLKMLKVLNVSWTPITKLPKSIGNMCNLEQFSARQCVAMDGEIPKEITKLSSLRCLDLFGTRVTRVPTNMNKLSHLQEFFLGDFDGLLPELPMSLTTLDIRCSSLDSMRVPDLSNLTNLVYLVLFDKMYKSLDISRQRVATPKMERLAKLTKLEKLGLVFADFTSPPIDLSSLSQLRMLDITYFELRHQIQLPPKLEKFTLYSVIKFPMEIGYPLFFGLKNVSTFELHSCRLREIQIDALGELQNLRILRVKNCKLVERLLGLSCLKNLRELDLCYCSKLIEIQGLDKAKMLEWLLFYRCKLLRSLPDIANKEKCNLWVYGCSLLPNFNGSYNEFLDKEYKKENVHKLEQKCGFYLDMDYLEGNIRNGNWDEVERYLCRFMKLDDNEHSMKMFYITRLMKYMEALDRKDRSKAEDILTKELKVFSEYDDVYEYILKKLSEVLTLDDVRKRERLSWCEDIECIRVDALMDLKELILELCEEKGGEREEIENAKREAAVEAESEEEKKEMKEWQGKGKPERNRLPLGFVSGRPVVACSFLSMALLTTCTLINRIRRKRA